MFKMFSSKFLIMVVSHKGKTIYGCQIPIQLFYHHGTKRPRIGMMETLRNEGQV